MRLSASSRAVSIRIGTLEETRMARARSKPVSPGIITSRIKRSKLRPPSLARASPAVSAVVTRYPSASRKRSRRSRIRRSSSTTRRCGAASDGADSARAMVRLDPGSAAQAPDAVGARDQVQHGLAMLGLDHGRKKPPRPLMGPGRVAERAKDPLGLQLRQPHGKRLALGRDLEQTLPAVVLARLLHHVALLDELAEHAAERLFGDPQQLEQIGNLHPRRAVDEMQHAMMGATETELGQNLVGVADEVPIGKKQ